MAEYSYLRIVAREQRTVGQVNFDYRTIDIHHDRVDTAAHPELVNPPTFTSVTDALNYFGASGWDLVSTKVDRRYKECATIFVLRKLAEEENRVVRFLRTTFNFDDETLDLGPELPANARLLVAEAYVLTAWSGGSGATMDIGDAADTDRILTNTQLALGSSGRKAQVVNILYNDPTQVVITYNRAGATAGQADILIRYVT